MHNLDSPKLKLQPEESLVSNVIAFSWRIKRGWILSADNTVGKFLKDRGIAVTNVLQKHSSCRRQKSELHVNASLKTYVTVFVASHWCPWGQAPPPACCFGWNAPERHCFLPPRWGFVSIFPRCFRLGTLLSAGIFYFQSSALVYGLDMTFRRLKKVNSSGPETGPACQDIYFPSSKSDSCRTADFQSSCSEVYSYRTLAYSGGTLPRNIKKVRSHFGI